jgi:hypothetical protein
VSQDSRVHPRQVQPILDPAADPRAANAVDVADLADTDTEDRRRLSNLRRRVLQRFGRRNRYLAAIEAVEPDTHAELLALRSKSPQAYRKRLQHEVRRLGLHGYLVLSRRAGPTDRET